MPTDLRKLDAANTAVQKSTMSKVGKVFDAEATAAIHALDARLTALEPVVPPPPPPSPPPGQAPYLSQDWSAGVSSPWYEEGAAASFKTEPGKLTLRTGPGSTGPNPVSMLASAYLNGGYQSGSPGSAWAKPGSKTWYSGYIRFPRLRYNPTTGEWNWVWEWHDASNVAGSFSNKLGVYSSPLPNPYGPNDPPGTNPYLFFVTVGGTTSAPVETSRTRLPGPLLFDHDYFVEWYFEWATSPALGKVEWYVDGLKIPLTSSEGGAVIPDGKVQNVLSHGLAPGMGLYNYTRSHNTFDSDIEFGTVKIGPTRASVQ